MASVLPKVHKDGVPVRPILAAYNTPSYNLAKFLTGFIQPLTKNQYTLENSYDFRKVLEGTSFPKSAFLVSFDIVSLFTNIPIKETVNIVTDSLYENTDYIRNITKAGFKKLLEICVSDNQFIFYKIRYMQH